MAENIYQKLAKIRKQVEVIKKTKDGYNYKYVPEDEILARVSVQMEKLNISLVPGVLAGTISVAPYSYTKTKTTRDGKTLESRQNEIIVNADMTYTWVNNDDPNDRIMVPWVLVGQQEDAAQAFGAGLTYAGRYFLLKYFNIATVEDDPDKFRSKQREVENAENEAVAKEIIERLDAKVRGFLAENAERKDEVRGFFSKLVKGGDYLKVKDPAVASTMLEKFQTVFENKTEGKD